MEIMIMLLFMYIAHLIADILADILVFAFSAIGRLMRSAVSFMFVITEMNFQLAQKMVYKATEYFN